MTKIAPNATQVCRCLLVLVKLQKQRWSWQTYGFTLSGTWQNCARRQGSSVASSLTKGTSAAIDFFCCINPFIYSFTPSYYFSSPCVICFYSNFSTIWRDVRFSHCCWSRVFPPQSTPLRVGFVEHWATQLHSSQPEFLRDGVKAAQRSLGILAHRFKGIVRVPWSGASFLPSAFGTHNCSPGPRMITTNQKESRGDVGIII